MFQNFAVKLPIIHQLKRLLWTTFLGNADGVCTVIYTDYLLGASLHPAQPFASDPETQIEHAWIIRQQDNQFFDGWHKHGYLVPIICVFLGGHLLNAHRPSKKSEGAARQ
jgi:hypothetical protein